MALVLKRNEGETWRQCAERQAKRYGLEQEVLEIFDHAVAVGEDEAEAAFGACYEWDVLDLEP